MRDQPRTRSTITLQPGVIGAVANRRLAPLGRKIGPDPASIDAAMIGGIAANNASGMCCGTAQNSYHTLAGMRIVLADGTVLDTRDSARAAPRFSRSQRDLVRGLDGLWRGARRASDAAARRAHPPQVPDQEHDRLQPECAGRFRRSDRRSSRT